ncbi:MAG: hypothetical protein WC455_10615 [Dehalococcoidia bacterium]|jgi:hypothetical protein
MSFTVRYCDFCKRKRRHVRIHVIPENDPRAYACVYCGYPYHPMPKEKP